MGVDDDQVDFAALVKFSYTFDAAAKLVEKLSSKLGVTEYAVNVFD